MSAAANELLRAVHATLTEDESLTALVGVDGIRDRLVTGRHLPCVIVSELVTTDYSTATEPGEQHVLTLQVWSDASGQKQVQQIASVVGSLLQDARLPLETVSLVNLQHLDTKTRREAKTRLFSAEMRFRAVTE
ncbi:DUF3168 domain-containing protein [Rhizobium sp. HT1-10]|uniref:DUF3168 domain-containing protein n=1 Tax=Rhizobium sp. HT1-10 TaxID=3111638 RepID=UPI003C18E1D9